MNDYAFDFEQNWDLVLPHLGNPLALRALNAGMVSLCDKGQTIWEPEKGPWTLTVGDFWETHVDRKFDAYVSDKMWNWTDHNRCPMYDDSPHWYNIWHHVNEEAWADKYARIIEKFSPKPLTHRWYQCYGGCHWIVAWNCAIGQLIYPKLDWSIIKGVNHSTAVGDGGDHRVFMDILWFDRSDIDGIWSESNTSECRISSLVDEIEWLETRPYLLDCEYCGSKRIKLTQRETTFEYNNGPYTVLLDIFECRNCGHIEFDADTYQPFYQ